MFSDLKLGVNVYGFYGFSTDFREWVAFIQSAEALGFDQMRLLDHVVGVPDMLFTDKSVLRETFTFLAYLSGVTSRIHFTTGIVILPQRQTVLVAKQAAEIDIMSGGRLTLGVGLGYSEREYQALGADFKTRAQVFEEQITLLRMLWTQNAVTFDGKYHTLDAVSLAPQPLQRPIPLFFGMGRTSAPIPPDVVLARCGRLADGWLPLFEPDSDGRIALRKVHDAAREAGRDPHEIVLEMVLHIGDKKPEEIRDAVNIRRDFGASRINFFLNGQSAAEQMDEIKRLAEVLKLG